MHANMYSRVRHVFRGAKLARMSSGHYRIIRDLGPVKGGKGLRHHEVVLDVSWPGLVRFVKSGPCLENEALVVVRRRENVHLGRL